MDKEERLARNPYTKANKYNKPKPIDVGKASPVITHPDRPAARRSFSEPESVMGRMSDAPSKPKRARVAAKRSEPKESEADRLMRLYNREGGATAEDIQDTWRSLNDDQKNMKKGGKVSVRGGGREARGKTRGRFV